MRPGRPSPFVVPPLPAACDQPIAGSAITFRLVGETQGAALLVVSPPHDIRRFVVEQEGRINQLTDTGVSDSVFLDLSNTIVCCSEQGLLGLAFHPDYATNRTFYVFYTTGNANVLARYQASATNPDVADPASGVVMLSIPDFAANHNGGMMEFGKDGYLYIGTGDGGGGGDPMRTAQDPNALLGKILRIDVNKKATGKEYGIPPSNPFASGTGGAPEVYIMGMRNPWRWSFDKKTGDLWIGDVGQDQIEELDLIPAGTPPANLGWSMYEAASCFNGPCDPAGKTMPQFSKTHAEGWCSLIGGEVYRGSCYTDAIGKYYFTDYCAHVLGVGTKTGSSLTVELPTDVHYIDGGGTHDGMPTTPASLHADSRGELYLTTTTCCGTSLRGGVFHLEAGP